MRKLFIALLILPLLLVLTEYVVRNSKLPTSPKKLSLFVDERSQLVTGLRRLGFEMKAVLGAPKIGNVCFGKNNFLFYCSTTDGSALEDEASDYVRRKPYELPYKADLAPYMDKVYFFTAPNKNRIFWDHFFVGAFITPHPGPSASVDEAALGLAGPDRYWNVQKMNALFQPSRDEMYYKHDSHWTAKGADLLLRSTGIPEAQEKIDFTKEAYSESDLINILKRFGISRKSEDIKFVPTNYTIQSTEGSLNETLLSNLKKQKSILIIGDSYRTGLATAASQFFGEVRYVHVNQFKPEILKIRNYDTIFIIRAERYLR